MSALLTLSPTSLFCGWLSTETAALDALGFCESQGATSVAIPGLRDISLPVTEARTSYHQRQEIKASKQREGLRLLSGLKAGQHVWSLEQRISEIVTVTT